ncbi:hypothetical protein ACH4VR_02800 [Streptomyces sp. NPDC020883]|uniref:hypothetical protein n=1 Tax=Streptomyces sp. NPDC020883 TaxID=3365099 RepID=UPI00379387DA
MHGQSVLMGALMFSTNFACFYSAEQHPTTAPHPARQDRRRTGRVRDGALPDRVAAAVHGVEHLNWTARDVAGVVLILLGNLVMVANPALLRRLTGRPAPDTARPALRADNGSLTTGPRAPAPPRSATQVR